MKALSILVFSLCLIGCGTTKQILEIEKRASAGDIEAQVEAGSAYDTGNLGAKQDYKKAFVWYMKAAKAGNASAQNSIGSMYQWGNGVQKNYKRAAAWYKKAAAQNYGPALSNLGYLYDEGMGTKVNDKKAENLYRKAFKAGYLPAAMNLGVMYAENNKIYEACEILQTVRVAGRNDKTTKKLSWQAKARIQELHIEKAKTPKEKKACSYPQMEKHI